MNAVVIGTNVTRMPLELKHPRLNPPSGFFPHHSFATLAGDEKFLESTLNVSGYGISECFDYARNPDMPRLVSQLRSHSTEIVVIDLIDERFNLAQFSNGMARPLTSDAIASFPEGLEYQTIRTATPEHYQLWEAGWAVFLAACDQHDIRDKLIIHESYLALNSKDGVPLRNSQVLAQVNSYLSRLYDRIRRDLGTAAFATSGTPDSAESAETGSTANPLSISMEAADPLLNLVEARMVHARSELPRAPEDVVAALCEAHSAVDLDSVVVHRAPVPSLLAPSVPGLTLVGPSGTRALQHTEHSIRVEVPLPDSQSDSNLFGMRFRFKGFDALSMSYVGDLVGGAVRGLRFRHLLQGVWHTETWSFQDPAYLISNRWPDDEPRRVHALVLELNGRMIPGEASVEVDWAATAQGAALDVLAGRGWDVPEDARHRKHQDEISRLLYGYLESTNSFYEPQARTFMETGRFPVYRHDQSLDWPPGAHSPVGTENLGTYRYLHHSLSLAASLLLVARDRKDVFPAVQARDLVNQWLDNNFFSRPEDPIYAWYDHGTPMRVLALLLVWHAFREHRGIDHRFYTRLENALDAQGHILASDAFYAQYQPVRHQNHAWFQDIGLIALAAMRGDSEVSKRWAEIGIRRLDDQFAHLIVVEGEHAIWSENSMGYHLGIISLIRFTRQLVELLGKNPWPDLTERMEAWSALVRYPDGRFPATGDTIPAPPARAGEKTKKDSRQGAHLWRTAGYALAAGTHEGSPFRLIQMATSVNLVHKQSDNGSFTLWFDDVEWLVDPGLISYDPNDGPAIYARGPWAHNAVVVEGLPYSHEPGRATLTGTSSEGSFSFTTEHSSFEGALVKRTLHGELSSLSVMGTDQATGASSSGVYTVFHAGPDVSIERTVHGLRLRSPRSAYALSIEVTGDCEIVSGWNGDERRSSVASSGLTSWAPTTSALVRHTSASGLQWVIRAELTPAPSRTQCDHDAVDLPPQSWNSVTAFADSPDLTDGIHSIRIDERTHLDVAIRGLPEGVLDAPLVIFFAGAVTTREKTRPPFFAGNSLTRRLRIPWVSISDPIFQLDPEITLGWYAGHRDAQLQDGITSLLERLSRLSQNGLLLVGGSGGGFASLYYASRVGAAARAFVWNPQIEIFDYAQGAVTAYLDVAGAGFPFPPLHRRDDLASELESAGVDHTATSLRDSGGVLILQNASDYHVIAQLAPLIRRESFPAVGQGRYASDSEHVLQLENWGTGHDPLPIDSTELILRLLLAGASMQAAGDELREHLAPSPEELNALPRDLSAERDELASGFRATVMRVSPDIVSVSWSITGRDRVLGGVFLNVFSMSESSPPIRLSGDLDGHQIDAPESFDRVPYRIVLRDGFGTVIAWTDISLGDASS